MSNITAVAFLIVCGLLGAVSYVLLMVIREGNRQSSSLTADRDRWCLRCIQAERRLLSSPARGANGRFVKR